MKLPIPIAVCLLAISCHKEQGPAVSHSGISRTSSTPDPLVLALIPHTGTARVDQEIIKLQHQVRQGRLFQPSLERLGWAFVAKARESFDAGFYKLAEQCAVALDQRQPRCSEALLLRGHVLHNLHQFKAAETLAKELIAMRGLPVDFGLLSDVLMEQGQLREATEACQSMIDLRPDLHSYARGAHLRWLKGDLNGAEHLMRMATDASSPRDPDSAAWVYTRLAGLQFQTGATDEAGHNLSSALEFRSNYPPALLLRGRICLAEGNYQQACELIRRATQLNPLPEYQWALAEALRAAAHEQEAAKIELELSNRGAMTDPRTFALYLSTRHVSPELAVRLAKEALKSREDVFTHDALAWALTSAGWLAEAQRESALALAENTQDARLFLHAGVLAQRTGRLEQAEHFAAKAALFSQTLLPSERAELAALQYQFATLDSHTNTHQ